MGKKPDYSDVATILFQDGHSLAKQYISRGTSRSSLLELMRASYSAMDGLIESFRNRCEKEDIKVDCRMGCSDCCCQAVLASIHEILLIDHYLREEMTVPVIKGIRKRTAEKQAITMDMSAMEFLQYIHPCPFLSEGECLIYPVRPMACRCYLSSSAESCHKQNDHPGDPYKIAALFEFPLKSGRGMNEGIRSALMEAGLIPSEWLLEALMSAVFEDEQIIDSWLAGKTSFNIRKLTAEENRYLRKYYDSQETTDSPEHGD